MNIEEINAKILLKNAQIQAEAKPNQKVELTKQLRVLQLKKEIETIKMKIQQLS